MKRRLRAVVALGVALAVVVAGVVARSGGFAGDGDSRSAIRLPRGTFVTSPRGSRAVLWAVGDGADGSKGAKAVADRIAAGRVDRFLYLGDVYGGGLLSADGTATDFRERYQTVYGSLAARTAPTPGNHEWPQRADGYDPYWTRVHGPPPAFYAFSAAGWRIISLNSEAPHGPGSPQQRWLADQVRGGGTCRLAFWHRPRFSAGRHGDQEDVAPLWETLAGRASIVLNGHDHDMQRLRPVDGLTEWVSGAGGHGRYSLKPDRRLAFANDRTYGALRVVLRPGSADVAFVAADGRTLDRHGVHCRRSAT